jgi:CelD/BcsL family acetyltransferase involved in cellulose biosynthesis
MKVVELSSEEWAGLLKAAHSATIFHSNEWLTVLERTYRCEVRRLGFLEGGNLVGGIPVCVRRKFIYRIAGSPIRGMVTPYQGPICRDPSDYAVIFEAFWQYVASMGWDFVEVTPSPDSPLVHWRPSDSRIRCEARRTIYLDFTPGEAKLFRKMDPSCQRLVRQSEKRGAECRLIEQTEKGWIDEYYQLAVELYQRQHRPPAIPKAFYENLWDLLGRTGKAAVFAVTFERQLVAGNINLVDNGILYGLDLASKEAYNYLRPNNLAEWAVIRWATQGGLRTYDMVGADIPGIANFKKGFGGHFVPYVTFHRSQNWIARFGECGYRRLAPLARRVAVRLGQ